MFLKKRQEVNDIVTATWLILCKHSFIAELIPHTGI